MKSGRIGGVTKFFVLDAMHAASRSGLATQDASNNESKMIQNRNAPLAD